MIINSKQDPWINERSYEHSMGRWSRKFAERFVDWLGPQPRADWVEVGCGTGALTKAILAKANPRSILATDLSGDFVAHTQDEIDDERVHFEVADALHLPCADASRDIATSALVLNFFPDTQAALAEMRRVLRWLY